MTAYSIAGYHAAAADPSHKIHDQHDHNRMSRNS